MKRLTQAFDFQRFQQNSRLAGIIHDVESRYAKAALSDDDLALVNAAGSAAVPTMTPETLLGIHGRPDYTEEDRP